MSLSYKPLWDMLEERNISKMEFAKSVNISNATLAKMGKNEPISLTTVDKICNKYACDINDIVKHITTIKIDNSSWEELDIGTIITSNLPLAPYAYFNTFDDKPYYYVIVAKEQLNQYSLFENILPYKFRFSELSFSKGRSGLYIPISNFKINSIESKTLYIRLDKTDTLVQDSLFQIIGTVPKKVLEKLIQFNTLIESMHSL